MNINIPFDIKRDVELLTKELLTLRSCNPSKYPARIAESLSEKNLKYNIEKYVVMLNAVHKIDPNHILFAPAYEQFLTTAQWDLSAYQSGSVLYALVKINTPTVCKDLKTWLATTQCSAPILRHALVAAAHNNNQEIIEFLLNAYTWFPRAIASLIPIAISKDPKFAQKLLNHPTLQNNKDDILFCILAAMVDKKTSVWDLMFSEIIPQLSASNIIASLNLYDKYATSNQKVRENFIKDLQALAQKDRLIQALVEEMQAAKSPLVKRKM